MTVIEAPAAYSFSVIFICSILRASIVMSYVDEKIAISKPTNITKQIFNSIYKRPY